MSRPPTDAAPTIYLMGMMGAGKSTLGRSLARELGRRFVDLDERIEERAGLSIPEIFRRHGEPHFRDLESAALAELRSASGLVVALGGGTPTRPQNREALRASGCVVYLRAQPETLAGRLGDLDERPLLRDADDPREALRTLRALLARREPDYDAIADVTIEVEADAASALERLMGELNRGGWLKP